MARVRYGCAFAAHRGGRRTAGAPPRVSDNRRERETAMGYRVMPGRALETVGEEALHAVQSTVHRRDGAPVLAMSFDPGTVIDTALGTHAVDLVLGLLTMRGWRRPGQPLRVDVAGDVAERWWTGELGPAAFVIETALSLQPGCDPDDVGHIVGLVSLAWSMELGCARQGERFRT